MGGIISSQNIIERVLISSPLKGHKTLKKVTFFGKFLLFKILDEFFMGIAILKNASFLVFSRRFFKF